MQIGIPACAPAGICLGVEHIPSVPQALLDPVTSTTRPRDALLGTCNFRNKDAAIVFALYPLATSVTRLETNPRGKEKSLRSIAETTLLVIAKRLILHRVLLIAEDGAKENDDRYSQ